jgi:hypothetical protein
MRLHVGPRVGKFLLFSGNRSEHLTCMLDCFTLTLLKLQCRVSNFPHTTTKEWFNIFDYVTTWPAVSFLKCTQHAAVLAGLQRFISLVYSTWIGNFIYFLVCC